MACILYIDPDVSVATSVVDYFAHAGTLQVQHVPSATHALQYLEATTPKLVILETALGKNGGLEFIHEFLSYPEWQHIPVVVFTQQNLQTYAARLKTLGVHSVLYKPQTSLQQLLKTVQQAL